MFKTIRKILSRRRRDTNGSTRKEEPRAPHHPATPDRKEPGTAEPQANDIVSLVDQMLSHGRYALLLREQIAHNLSSELYHKASQALEESMGLVPAGEVHVEPSVFDIDYPLFAAENAELPQDFTVQVQSVFLDRYLVTNRQFQQFVAAGGYQEMAIWEPEIWPAVLDFTDRTGEAGPRFWHNGRFLAGEANKPVVGISWYEALAYARWVGKRLPTEAEWVKASSWPVTLSPGTHLQRKFPWGDGLDRGKANVWGSSPGAIVAVEEFKTGVSVGGLYQLIGNVWEWTSTTLETDPAAEDEFHGRGTLLKTIRGGAYDTYFEHQANCQFASGEHPILRKHNIGFRCALSVCDIAALPGEPLAESARDDADLHVEAMSLEPSEADHSPHTETLNDHIDEETLV